MNPVVTIGERGGGGRVIEMEGVFERGEGNLASQRRWYQFSIKKIKCKVAKLNYNGWMPCSQGKKSVLPAGE